jgi:hypothetical protein
MVIVLSVVVVAALGVAAAVVAMGPRSTTTAGLAAATGRSATGGVVAAPPSPSPSPTPAPFTGDLRRLLLSRPAGASKYTAIGNPDGTVTLAQVAADNSVDPRSLNSLGFKQGAEAGWSSGAHISVDILLYQFRDSSAASAWQRVYHATDPSDPDVETLGDLPGVPQGRYFGFRMVDRAGNFGVYCYFARGDIAGEVWYYDRHFDPAALISLAQRQYARLPGA